MPDNQITSHYRRFKNSTRNPIRSTKWRNVYFIMKTVPIWWLLSRRDPIYNISDTHDSDRGCIPCLRGRKSSVREVSEIWWLKKRFVEQIFSESNRLFDSWSILPSCGLSPDAWSMVIYPCLSLCPLISVSCYAYLQENKEVNWEDRLIFQKPAYKLYSL